MAAISGIGTTSGRSPRSSSASRWEDRDDRYFGLVSSQDADPRRRFCAVLMRQGPPADQPVTVLTDGGDSVCALVGGTVERLGERS
jgi:hypothetical protein